MVIFKNDRQFLIIMKNSGFSILYFLTGIIYIILQPSLTFLGGLITKALIIPLLMALFLVNLNPLKNRLHLFMLAGLFFSWAGDLTLEFSQDNSNMFIAGLICFLLTHVMYFTVFLNTPGKNCILSSRIYLLLPVIIYGVTLVYFLYDDLADMRLPVIFYAIVLLTMLSGAINRIEKVGQKSYWLVLSGAILFVISDSAIAINKFSVHFASSGVFIMSTYIVAQYLILAGYINQFRKGLTIR
jgi:uncharacterized membrane protein YhhN